MMGNNKFIIRPNQEQAITKVRAMLDGLEPDDSIMVIQIKEHDTTKVETTSVAALNPNHLPAIQEAFGETFKRSFEELIEQNPMLAAKSLMEFFRSQKD